MASSISLFPYQRRWVLDKARYKIGMMARQIGKTWTTSLEIVNDCMDAEAHGARARWVILSRGERQAREAMEEGVKRHLQAYQAAFKSIDVEWVGSHKALDVVLPNGSKITALPANPDTARGFSANVFLDEFAFHQDSRKIWTALFPVISAGHKIRVVSTPNGKANKFYELITADDDEWSRHIVDIYQAVDEGLPRDVDELRRAIRDDDAWAQEFELQWLDEASAWLSYELISACEDSDAGDPSKYAGGPCYSGEDIGIRSDLWVNWVLEEVGDVLWTRLIEARKRIPFHTQDSLRDEAFGRFRINRHCMDQTGMGEKPVEDAQRKWGSMRVEGVQFTAGNKLTLATLGRELFEDRRIRIPLGDPALRADLHKLRRVDGPTGSPRFVAESDAAGHADRTWACFLAANAAARPTGPVEYQPINRRRFAVGAGTF